MMLNKVLFSITAAASVALADFTSPVRDGSYHTACSTSALSCSGTDSCCLEGTNGLFLATQFWDFNPATGPDTLFTTHGLWSDTCSGGYNQYCNPSWEIDDVTTVLQDLGLTDLLATMQKTWKNQGAADSELWLHEFNKHGTCMATINPSCYVSSAPANQYVGDFFQTVVDLQAQLPTYDVLKAAGITPTTAQTYSRSDIESALSSSFEGHDVYLGCTSSGALQEVWYFFNLQGSVANGKFFPTDSVSTTTCPDQVYYIPKGESVPSTTDETQKTTNTKTTLSTAIGTSTSVSNGKGTITLSGESGCLISAGTWYASGTCASFTLATVSGGFTLKSSKGYCAVTGGVFSCSSGNSATTLTMSGNSILYNGNSVWSADSVAASQNQVSIKSGSSGSVTFSLIYTSN